MQLHGWCDREYPPENEGIDHSSKDFSKICCVSVFDTYFDKGTMLSTCSSHKHLANDQGGADIIIKTALPQVKTMERLDYEAKIHNWLVNRGG